MFLRRLELRLSSAPDPFWLPLLGDSKPRVYGREWNPALDRHGFQRVGVLRSAVTTHLVGLTLQREDTTEVSVVTSKKKIEYEDERRHKVFFAVLYLAARTVVGIEGIASRRPSRDISEQPQLL